MLAILTELMDKELGKRIDQPATYIQMGAFVKILRAALAIALFALNSTMNDFFVCYFFMVTSLLGYIYLRMCGFEVPKDTGKEEFA